MKDRRKQLTILALSVAMTLGSTSAALAEIPDAAPGEAYARSVALLQDSHMEYGEIADLVKTNYGPIKSAYEMSDNMEVDQGSIAAAMRVVADDYMSQAEQLKEMMGGNNAAIMPIVSGARKLRSSAASMDRALERSNSKKDIDRQANKVIAGVETLMNQYEAYQAQRAVLAKALEISQTAQAIQQTMQAQGLAVDADVLSAASQLASASSQLASADAALEQMYKSLCQLTGWDKPASVTVIGPVPSADISLIETFNLEEDKEKAVNNNYEIIAIRSGSSAGMTDFQARTSKSTTKTANKIRTVEYSQAQVRSNMQTLYDTIFEKKSAYDSAATALQGAQLTWNAAQIQRQNGSTSQIQYLQQELAYLQAQAAFRGADLNLRQAIENYSWAVKGLSVETS